MIVLAFVTIWLIVICSIALWMHAAEVNRHKTEQREFANQKANDSV